MKAQKVEVASPSRTETRASANHAGRPAATETPRQQAQDARIAQLSKTAPATNRTGLPDTLKHGIEALSGMDMSAVRVHRNSSKPAEVQAHAFAKGSEIHLGPGEDRHLPHEAWHVVQQRQGRVQATTSVGGIGVNDSPSLEREADRMGAQALQARAQASSGAPAAAGAGLARGVEPALESRATSLQRKLLFDPGTVSYSLDDNDQDYAFVGNWRSNGLAYYVRYDDLDKLRSAAAQIWEKVKETYGNSGNLAKIKAGEESGNFEEAAHLAPGEAAYEDERREKTTLYLIGSRAQGKDFYRPLVAPDGPWVDLKFYRANDEDDDKASAMVAVPASELAHEDNYEHFAHLLTESMLAQGEPMEKSVGGGGDRTALARGKVFVSKADLPAFSWDAADNPYLGKLDKPEIDGADDLAELSKRAGSVSFRAGGIDAVYSTTQPSRARTGRNFYVAGKPYTASQLDDKRADKEITDPWDQLKAKAPTEQKASTFTRKDRGKGQADAMGKWSAAAAVAVSNRIDKSSYNENLAWEWLHLRGAGLGGATVAGNLTPGTYSANSEMIPIENRIKQLKSKPEVDTLGLRVEPRQVKGVFAKQIEMHISVRYKGLLSAQSGSWTIDPYTGAVFDKFHEARLKADLTDSLNVRVVGSDVILWHKSGLMTGPCRVVSEVGDNLYLVELSEDEPVIAERQPNGRFVYNDMDDEEG
jgi:hypothetical protein